MNMCVLAVQFAPRPTSGSASVVGVIIMLLCYAFIFALVVIGLIRLVKFLGSATKEVKLMRMEIGKLAEEVHQIKGSLASDNQKPM